MFCFFLSFICLSFILVFPFPFRFYYYYLMLTWIYILQPSCALPVLTLNHHDWNRRKNGYRNNTCTYWEWWSQYTMRANHIAIENSTSLWMSSLTQLRQTWGDLGRPASICWFMAVQHVCVRDTNTSTKNIDTIK